MSRVLIVTQVLLFIPLPAVTAASPVTAPVEEEKHPAPVETPEHVSVNRTVPQVTAPVLLPSFSVEPSDLEITRARVFVEPLVPVGATSLAENIALARALMAYIQTGGAEDGRSLEAFLREYPDSAWRASLLANLGALYRRRGYFSRALEAFEEAWRLTKSETDLRTSAVGDQAVGDLAELVVRLGRKERLEELLAETSGRDVHGSATEKLAQAAQGLGFLQQKPEIAYRCGPMALDRMLASTRQDYVTDPKLVAFVSTPRGTSLAQMQALSESVGQKARVVKRATGSAMLVPALVHWKAGHFAAIVKMDGGRYLFNDPTFGDEYWITARALDDETPATCSCLRRVRFRKAGRRSERRKPPRCGARVFRHRCLRIFGPAHPQSGGSGGNCSCNCNGGGGGPPMAVYSFHTMLVNLHITDTPVGYSPARGPSVQFQLTYNQREVSQPQTFSYSNLGQKWTFDWISYVEDDPNPLNTTSVDVYVRGGGKETSTGFDGLTGSYAPQAESHVSVGADLDFADSL